MIEEVTLYMNYKFSREVKIPFSRVDLKEDFFGSSPAPFVGHNFYPNLYVGIMSPPEIREDAWLYDAPHYWGQHDFTIPEVVNFRSSLVNSRFRINIKATNKFLEIGKEIGMASRPVDVEINLTEKPKMMLQTDRYHAPTGPLAKLKKAKITENAHIEYKVDKVVSDADLKAQDALTYLYKSGFDENFLTRLISMGTLGVQTGRKLVPTRWAITAVDDTLGKHLREEVLDFSYADYQVYFGGYLGNYYAILLFSEPWSYELFEMGVPLQANPWSKQGKFWATDYENHYGRKGYATETAGGYYAARIVVLEKLKEMKRKASVLCLRFISNEYTMPLGVWVVREAVRKALQSRPLEFGSWQLMVEYVQNLAKKKFNADVVPLFSESIMLRTMRTQAKLTQFIR